MALKTFSDTGSYDAPEDGDEDDGSISPGIELDLDLFTDDESYNKALSQLFKSHYRRIVASTTESYHPYNLADWMCDNTKLRGKKFSFKGYEFQRDILTCPDRDVIVVKVAQVGLSEVYARWATALMATQKDFTVIWTFPKASDAEEFSKARLNPIISSSKILSKIISGEVNSVSLRQFGTGNFMYMRGTMSETQALSVPADALIHDELDRSDMAKISAYRSRLLNSPWKLSRVFSTPTANGVGILKAAETANRLHQAWTCSHCNHKFFPDYYQNVKIPGYSGPLEEIKLWNLPKFRYEEAKLLCPKCGKEPSSDVTHREWVRENNEIGSFDSTAFFVTPFCAPMIRTPAALIRDQTRFNNKAEFDNQSLGKAAVDSAEALTEGDVHRARANYAIQPSGMHCMGIDVGATSYILIGKEVDGVLAVVHAEKVPYTNLLHRKSELAGQYRVISTVADALPYTDLIARMIDCDPRMYAAFYVDRKSTELFTIRQQQSDPEEGKLNIQSVSINREVAFDTLMERFKANQVVVSVGDLFNEFSKHCLDMQRVQKFDNRGGIVYKWVKTQGNDHFHHALGYLHIATKLQQVGGSFVPKAFSLLGTANVKGVALLDQFGREMRRLAN